MTTSPSFKDSVLDVFCGSVAGASGKFIEYPFDTVKVRLQSQPDHLPPRFHGPLDCFKQTLRNEGIYGLFRGISSPVVGAAAENASLFVSYSLAQQVIRANFYSGIQSTDRLPDGVLLLCGAISGIVTSFILTPIELVKCQMQVQSLYGTTVPVPAPATKNKPSPAPRIAVKSMHTATAHLPGPLQLVSNIYKREGLAGFWRGQTGTLFREAGGSAAWFGCYEYVSKWFRTYHKRDTNTTGESMMAGAVAGVAFNLSLFPADTIKSRIQTESLTISGASNGAGRNRGFFEVGRLIYRSGGIKALYRGCGITIGRAAPSSAIIFATYEKLKEISRGYF